MVVKRIIIINWGFGSVVERVIIVREVAGSVPEISIFKIFYFCFVFVLF